MSDFAIGDQVRMKDGTEGRILGVGSEVFVEERDGGERSSVQLEAEMAYVEITNGPAAGKPYGFEFVPTAELERVEADTASRT